MIKISIIVPVYRVEKYLRECIDSILAQTLIDFELILVDDGSPDGCPRICDEYEKKDSRIKTVHKKNGGLSSARNAGLKTAGESEYTLFVDSDDFLMPDALESLYTTAKKFDADIVQAGYLLSDEDGNVIGEFTTNMPAGILLFHADICRQLDEMSGKGHMIYCWRNFYRSRFLSEKSLMFDENISIAEDAPFNIQAFLLAQRVTATADTLYVYRKRSGSIMTQSYKPDYDLKMNFQWSKKVEAYETYCQYKSSSFYTDLARYTITAILPNLLGNIYKNDVKHKKELMVRTFETEMIKRSFADFDIIQIRSRSLDWLLFLCAKNRLYLPAHILCRYILYKQ